MQNNNYQRRHPRRSSPSIEGIEGGFNKWVSGLRPIKQAPQDSLGKNQKWVLTAKESGPVVRPYSSGRNQKWILTARESGPVMQPCEEGRGEEKGDNFGEAKRRQY